MDTVYEAAVRRADELKEELDLLNDFIRLYRTARYRLGLEKSEQIANSTGTQADTSESQHEAALGSTADVDEKSQAEPMRKRVTDNPKPAVVIDAAISILREHGSPMSRRALHESLARHGLDVRGADPVKALGTMLWRGNDRLVQLEGYGYWPKEDQYFPAGYFPNLEMVTDRQRALLAAALAD